MSRLNVNTISGLSSTVPKIDVPAFRVGSTTNQSITTNVSTKVQFDSVIYDTHGWWDAVNYQWQPQIAGYYWLSTLLQLSGSSITRRMLEISATGDDNIRVLDDNATNSINIRAGGALVYCNGTTDHVSLFAFILATSPQITAAGGDFSYSRFEGYLVRAA